MLYIEKLMIVIRKCCNTLSNMNKLLVDLFPCNEANELFWKCNDLKTYSKYSQYVEEEKVVETSQKTEKVRGGKRQLPMDVILQLSENIPVNADYVKTSLIDFISTKDFQKLFGVKKTSEVMKAMTENKWNKSLVLFLSFIFDVAFVYLNKDVVYDSAKTYDKKLIL